MAGGDSTITDRINGAMMTLAVKAPCAVVATSPITLSGFPTIDGVTVAATVPPTRVLVVGQADQTTNGIYDVAIGNWTRSVDFDGAYDASTGTYVNVYKGTFWARSFWQLTCTDAPIVFGTSQLTFALLSVPPLSPFGGNLATLRTVTANTTLTSADGVVEVDCTAGDVTITCPISLGKSIQCQPVKLLKIDATANRVFIIDDGGPTVRGAIESAPVGQQMASAIVHSNGTALRIT